MALVSSAAATLVMIIEPEVETRTLAAERLRAFGLRVVEAASAEEAVSFLRDGAPIDLIFREIEVPDGR